MNRFQVAKHHVATIMGIAAEVVLQVERVCQSVTCAHRVAEQLVEVINGIRDWAEGPNQCAKSPSIDPVVDCVRSDSIGKLQQTRIDAFVPQEQVSQLNFQELGGLGNFAKFPVNLIQRRHLPLIFPDYRLASMLSLLGLVSSASNLTRD